MSSKPKRNGITEPQATSTQAEAGEVSVGNSARDEEIRRRAYEIYLERGERPGRDLDDWLRAERELERGVFRRAQAGHEANPRHPEKTDERPYGYRVTPSEAHRGIERDKVKPKKR